MSGVDPIWVYALVISIVVAVVAQAILWVKRRGDPEGPYDPIDWTLWALTAPVLLIAAAVVFVESRRPEAGREDDDDLSPDEPVDRDEESRTDQVIRIVEAQAEEVEDHVLNEATDDEVAGRGASIFDPGVGDDRTA